MGSPALPAPAGESELQLFIAGSGRVALVIVRELSVRTEAIVRVLAPEDSVIAVLDRGIPLGIDEHALPAQHVAAVLSDYSQSRPFHDYAFPRAASSRARLMATRANCTL